MTKWLKNNQKPLFLMFIIILICSVFNRTDPDVYWHIANGESLLNNGLTSNDFFSYWGGNFISHEWLFDILIFIIFNIGGYTTLKVFSFVCIGATFLIAFKLGEKRTPTNPLIYLIPLLILIPNMMFLEPRPQILSTLLFVTTIYILENKKHLWSLPILTLLTVNVHGGAAIFTILITAVYLINLMFDKEEQDKKLIKTFLINIGLMVITLAITPYGLECVTYGSKLPKYVLSLVDEWKVSIVNYDDMFTLFLFLLPLAAMAYTRKAKLIDILMLCLGMMSAFIYLRLILIFVPIYIIFGCPYIMLAIQKVLDKFKIPKLKSIKFNYLLPSLILIVLICINIPNISLQNGELNSSFAPKIVVDYIKENNIDVENNVMLNNYNFGGYLIFNGYKTFIDGRTDVFLSEFGNEDVFKDYYYIMDVRNNVDELLNKYNVKYYALYKQSKLTNYLIENNLANVLAEDETYILLEHIN